MKLAHPFWAAPYEERYHAEIQDRLAADTHHVWNVLGVIVLVIQVFMTLSLCLRPGGPFHTPRRTGYVALYILLMIITAIFLVFHNRCSTLGGAAQLRIGTIYAGINCCWACAVTALDQLGGNGLVVFSYVLMTIAALVVLTTLQSFLLFGGSFIVLNVALMLMPEGLHNLFSNVVNSFVLCLLAIVISCSLHRSRAAAHYANLRLGELTVTDQLTGLNNRRYLEVDVRHRLNTLKDSPLPVACFMVDIDYFKQYNDHHGHQAGDHCLKITAQTLETFAAQGDIYVARYGGEEFLLCWIDCDAALAAAAAERLRQAAAAQSGRRGVPITVSIGVSTRSTWGDTVFEDFIREADTALYQAKADGRNRVVLYQNPEVT